MLKLTLIVSFMILGTMIWAGRLSCDSCGSECAAACGTRRFRTCCFNYLRKKRGPETELWTPTNVDATQENSLSSKVHQVENIPEQIIASLIADEYKPNLFDGSVDNQALV